MICCPARALKGLFRPSEPSSAPLMKRLPPASPLKPFCAPFLALFRPSDERFFHPCRSSRAIQGHSRTDSSPASRNAVRRCTTVCMVGRSDGRAAIHCCASSLNPGRVSSSNFNVCCLMTLATRICVLTVLLILLVAARVLERVRGSLTYKGITYRLWALWLHVYPFRGGKGGFAPLCREKGVEIERGRAGG